MHRNAHPTAPGGHHHDGDAARGIAPTVVPAATMEALQEELCNFIESRGIVLNKADNTQLKQAILDAIGKTVGQGDFVTHTEFKLHTEGGDPHQQYALESMLGDAATKDVGTAAHQVAAGNHEHSQYERKDNLKQGAYRDVGTGSNQLAAGDHSHQEFTGAILGIRFTESYYRQIHEGDHTPEVPGALVTAVNYAEYLNETSQSYRMLQIYQGGIWKTVAY
ncbi:MAG: hypothetical protein ACRCXB_30310 [Aeromonadaceae bacterium]